MERTADSFPYSSCGIGQCPSSSFWPVICVSSCVPALQNVPGRCLGILSLGGFFSRRFVHDVKFDCICNCIPFRGEALAAIVQPGGQWTVFQLSVLGCVSLVGGSVDVRARC